MQDYKHLNPGAARHIALREVPLKNWQKSSTISGLELAQAVGHERALADGVNVGYEVYRIKVQVTA